MRNHIFHTIEFHSAPIFPLRRVIQFFLCDIPIFLTSYIFHLTQYHISFKVIKENINETTQETNHWGTAVVASLYLSSSLFFTPIVTSPLPLTLIPHPGSRGAGFYLWAVTPGHWQAPLGGPHHPAGRLGSAQSTVTHPWHCWKKHG